MERNLLQGGAEIRPALGRKAVHGEVCENTVDSDGALAEIEAAHRIERLARDDDETEELAIPWSSSLHKDTFNR